MIPVVIVLAITLPLGAPPETVQAYQTGCDRAVAASCTNLGRLYFHGDGVSRDLVKARALYEKACTANDAMGCNNLAAMLIATGTTGPDADRARTLWAKACEQGA